MYSTLIITFSIFPLWFLSSLMSRSIHLCKCLVPRLRFLRLIQQLRSIKDCISEISSQSLYHFTRGNLRLESTKRGCHTIDLGLGELQHCKLSTLLFPLQPSASCLQCWWPDLLQKHHWRQRRQQLWRAAKSSLLPDDWYSWLVRANLVWTSLWSLSVWNREGLCNGAWEWQILEFWTFIWICIYSALSCDFSGWPVRISLWGDLTKSATIRGSLVLRGSGDSDVSWLNRQLFAPLASLRGSKHAQNVQITVP